MLEVAALLAGLSEATLAEATAVESAAIVSEMESVKDLIAILEETTVPTPEILDEIETAADSAINHPGKGIFEKALSTDANGEFAMEAAESVEKVEFSEDVSEQDYLTVKRKQSDVGHTPLPLIGSGYISQIARISERAAVAFHNAALRSSTEIALAENAVQAEELLEQAELLEEISSITDKAGDFFGAASYPEFMLRRLSPDNK